MTLTRTLLLAFICCAVVALTAGPLGRLVVILPLLLFAPGYLITSMLRVDPPPNLFVRPALWLGLSLSAVALLYQWTTALSLPLSIPALWVFATFCALCTALLIWQGEERKNRELGVQSETVTHIDRRDLFPSLSTLALLALFLVTLWLRFTQIKGLVLPSWVDSVHHALMIRVAAEHGAVPYSLTPYLPIEHLAYHWGYHVFTAAVMQLSGVSLPQVMLWEGQVFNALHVLTCAALAAYLWRRSWAGVVAGLVVGLLSIMPAYYVSWGRYTQLTGLLLLPPLAIVWIRGLRSPSWGNSICVAVLLAGLSVIHFRVLIFALCLIAASGIVWATGQNWTTLRPRLWHALASFGLTAGLTIPWLIVLIEQRLLLAIDDPHYLVSDSGYNDLNQSLLWAGQNRLMIALALAAALWGLARRSRIAMAQAIWLGILIVLANPWLTSYLFPVAGVILILWSVQYRRPLVGLCGLVLLSFIFVQIPYFWLITSDVILISLFIPLAVLIGGGSVALLTTIENWVMRRWREGRGRTLPLLVRGLGALVLVIAALWGAQSLQGPSSGVLNQGTILATQADVDAITWAATYTPPNARFLINAVNWLPGADRGTDGGWWLMPLAGRWTSTPPVIYTYGSGAYVTQAHSISQQVVNFQNGQEQQLYQMIEQEHISYIYLGAQQKPLSFQTFANNPMFEKVYQHNGVTILAVNGQA